MGQIVVGPGDDEIDDDELLDELDDEQQTSVEAPDDGSPAEDLQSQIERLQAAVRRNNGELAKRRALGKWMQKHKIDDLDAWLQEKGIDPTTGQRAAPPAAPAPQETPPAEEAPAEPAAAPAAPAAQDNAAAKDLERKLEVNAVRTEALQARLRDLEISAALKAVNYTGTMERALRLLNLENISVAEDGAVVGVESEVKGLQEEFPEMFNTRRPAPPPPPARGAERADGGDKRPNPQRPKTWVEQISNTLTRG